jgi:hypothetical protein
VTVHISKQLQGWLSLWFIQSFPVLPSIMIYHDRSESNLSVHNASISFLSVIHHPIMSTLNDQSSYSKERNTLVTCGDQVRDLTSRFDELYSASLFGDEQSHSLKQFQTCPSFLLWHLFETLALVDLSLMRSLYCTKFWYTSHRSPEPDENAWASWADLGLMKAWCILTRQTAS